MTDSPDSIRQLWRRHECDPNAADLKALWDHYLRMGDLKENGSSTEAREVLARNIKALRAQRGWSQEELALECGLHRTFVAHVERRARNISLDNVARIAMALQVPLHRLLEPQESES